MEQIFSPQQQQLLVIDYLVRNHDRIKEQARHLVKLAEGIKQLDPMFEDEIKTQLLQRIREIITESLTKHLPMTTETAMLVVESLDLEQLYIHEDAGA